MSIEQFKESNFMEKIKTRSTSLNTAEADPIILRETKTTRLIFKPSIVSNPKDQKACVRGLFVFQRKSPSDKWEEYNKFPLNKLKSGEGVKLELRSGEIKILFDNLKYLKTLYKEHGIPWGESSFSLISGNIPKFIIELTKLNFEDKSLVIQELNKLSQDELNRIFKDFSLAIQNIKRKKAVEKFEEMLSKELSEYNWQKWFKENDWILGTDFIKIVDERQIDTQNISDYLVQAYDGFLDIIEIKRPSDELPFWAKSKDHDNFIPSTDLIKAIIQATNYIYKVEQESNSKKFSERVENIKVIKPRCTLIFGRSNEWKDKEFEAYRILNSSFHSLTILTYDQVLSRAKQILGSLKEGIKHKL